jgi:hypothetical protein
VYTCVGGGLGTLVGPWIHVMHVWRSLICKGSLSWIGDVIDLGDACMAVPYWLSLKWWEHGGVLSPHFLC